MTGYLEIKGTIVATNKTKAANEIKDAINAAPEILPESKDGVPDDSKNSGGKVEYLPTINSLPPDFPVVCLGVMGEVAYFLDGMSQLRPLKFKDFAKTRLQSLFIPYPAIVSVYWPRFDKDGKKAKTGWAAEEAATVLMTHVATAGIFNPVERIRGRGCHLSEAGELIWHLGNVILINGQRQKPGYIGEHVYPGAERCMAPKYHDDIEFPGYDLKDLFNQWEFSRPGLDSQLLLGWVMAAKIGGALDWRPLVWITGDKATGKSTLHKILSTVLNDVIAVTDATGAGIWQKLGYDTLPVMIDELEADADNRQSQKVIKLAREAASGGAVLRGGADHQGMEFKARSCFLFSSILHPPLPPQDKSRLAILSLNPIPAKRRAPEIDLPRLKRIGQSLMERFHRHFAIFPKILAAFVDGLIDVGHGGRSADVYGTLLACSHLAQFDNLPTSDQVDKWVKELSMDVLYENDDQMNDAEACLHHLLTTEVSPWSGGTQKVISEVVNLAVKEIKTGDTMKQYLTALERYGMKVIIETSVPGREIGQKYPLLLVANQHKTLGELFKGTQWQGRSDSPGVWLQSLRRIGIPWKNTRFRGVQQRCTALFIDEIISFTDG